MASFQIVINIADSTLPNTQRQVVLTGVAASMSTLLAQYYQSITIAVESSYAIDDSGMISHEINGSIASPYYAVYGGS